MNPSEFILEHKDNIMKLYNTDLEDMRKSMSLYQSNDYNDVRLTHLVNQFDVIDGELEGALSKHIDSNSDKVAFMVASKYEAFLSDAKKASKKVKRERLSIVQKNIAELSDYSPDKKDNYVMALQAVGSINEDLSYGTFGVSTTVDHPFAVSDSIISRVFSRATDFTMTGNAFAALGADPLQRDAAIYNEALMQGVIKESSFGSMFETTASIALGVAMGTAERIAGGALVNKTLKNPAIKNLFPSKYNRAIPVEQASYSKLQNVISSVGSIAKNEYTRQAIYGGTLAALQAVNDDEGLTKQLGLFSSETWADAIQAGVAYAAGTAISNKWIMPAITKKAAPFIKRFTDEFDMAIQQGEKTAAKSVLEKLVVKADEWAKTATDRQAISYLKANIDNVASKVATTENVSGIMSKFFVSSYAGNQASALSWHSLGALTDTAVDYALDVASVNMLESITNGGLFSPSTIAMFKWKEGDWRSNLEGVGINILHRLSGKASAKAAGLAFNLNIDRRSGIVGEAGTTDWIAKEAKENNWVYSDTAKMYTHLYNLFIGNDMKRLDTYIRSVSPNSSLSEFISDKLDTHKLVMAAAFAEYAKTKSKVALSGYELKRTEQFNNVFESISKVNIDSAALIDSIVDTTHTDVAKIEFNNEDPIAFGSRVADKLTEDIAVNKLEGKTRFALTESDSDRLSMSLSTLLRGFVVDNTDETQAFYSAVIRGIEKNLINKAIKADSSEQARPVSLSDISGIAFLDIKRTAQSIPRDAFVAEHIKLRELLNSDDIKKTASIGDVVSKESISNAVEMITLLKNKEVNDAVNTALQNTSVIPRMMRIDLDIVKDLSDKLSADTHSVGEIRTAIVSNPSRIRELVNAAVDTYVKRIENLTVQIEKGNKPSTSESSELAATAIKLIHITQNAGIPDVDVLKRVDNALQNNMVRTAIEGIMDSNTMGNALASYADVAKYISTAGYSNVIVDLIGLAGSYNIASNSVNALILNTVRGYISSAVHSEFSGKFGALRTNWLADFAMNSSDSVGFLREFTYDGKQTSIDGVEVSNAPLMFNDIVYKVLNGDALTDDEAKFASAYVEAKRGIAEMFKLGTVDKQDESIKAGNVELSLQGNGFAINVKKYTQIDPTDTPALRAKILEGFAPIREDVSNVDNRMVSEKSMFELNGSSYTVDDVIRRLEKSTNSDISIKDAVRLVYQNGVDVESRVKALITSLLPKNISITSDVKYGMSDNDITVLSKQLIKQASFQNVASLTLDRMQDGKLKNLSISYENQDTSFDNYEGMRTINIGIDDELKQRISSATTATEFNTLTTELAKIGIHNVGAKGNTTDPIFVYIDETRPDGSIPARVIRKAAKQLSDRMVNMSLDPEDSKLLSKLSTALSKDGLDYAAMIKELSAYATDRLAMLKELGLTKVKVASKNNETVELFKKNSATGKSPIESYADSVTEIYLKYAETIPEEVKSLLDEVQRITDPKETETLMALKERINSKAQSLFSILKVDQLTETDKAQLDAYVQSYEAVNVYSNLKDAKDVYTNEAVKSIANLEKYISMLSGLRSDDDRAKVLLTFLGYGKAALHETKLQKRSSYLTNSRWLKSDGDYISKDVENMFLDIARDTKIYITATGGDGAMAIPKSILGKLSIATDMTIGKLVSNSEFGGMKINAITSERLAKSGILYGTNIDASKSVFIDMSVWKTVYPELLSSIQSVDGNDYIYELSGFNVWNSDKAMLLASMTLHSPTNTFSKEMSNIGTAIANSGSLASTIFSGAYIARYKSKNESISVPEGSDLLDVYKWHRKVASNINIAQNNLSAMSKVSEFKGNPDVQVLSKDHELNKSILPKTSIPTYILATMLAKVYNNAELPNEQRIQAKTLAKSLSETFDSQQFEQSKLNNDVLSALKVLSTGKDAFIQSYTVGGETVYMVNMVRYPSERAGQNFSALIVGVHNAGYDTEISDFHYRKVHGGDYDGDAIQIIGLSTSNVREGMIDSKLIGSQSVGNEVIIKQLQDAYYDAVATLQANATFMTKGSMFNNFLRSPGTAVAPNDFMSFYRWGVKRLAVFNAGDSNKSANTRNNFFDSVKKALHIDPLIIENKPLITNISNYSFGHHGSNRRVVVFSGSSNPVNDVDKLTLHYTVSDVIALPAGKEYVDKNGRTYTAFSGLDAEGATVTHIVMFDNEEGQALSSGAIVKRQIAYNDEMYASTRNSRFEALDAYLKGYIERVDNGTESPADNLLRYSTEQQIIETANAIGVNNMKNNTLSYVAQIISDPSKYKDFAALMSTALEMPSALAVKHGGNFNGIPYRVSFDAGLNDKIQEFYSGSIGKYAYDAAVKSTMYDIRNGVAGISDNEFNSLKKLIGNATATDDEVVAGIRAAQKAYQLELHSETTMPMIVRINAYKIAKAYNASQDNLNNHISKVISYAGDDLKAFIRSNMPSDEIDPFMSVRSIKGSDIDPESATPDKIRVKNPVVSLLSWHSMLETFDGMLSPVFSSHSKQKFLRMLHKSTARFYGVGITEDTFYAEIARAANSIGGRYANYSAGDVKSILNKLGLHVADERINKITEDFIAEQILNESTKGFEADMAKELIDRINTEKLDAAIVLKQGTHTLQLNKLLNLFSKYTKPSINDSNEADKRQILDVFQALVTRMTHHQQVASQLYANGLTDMTTRYLDMNSIDILGLESIETERMQHKHLMKNASVEIQRKIADTQYKNLTCKE